MKKYLVLGLVLLSFWAKAQETEKVSVAKELFGVQLGLISASFQYEFKLDRKLTLMGEVGAEYLYSSRERNDAAKTQESVTIIAPYIAFEPRWYYGLDRRQRLGKNTQNNSSNYVGLTTSYFSTQTPLFKSGDYGIVSAIRVIPRYGIRRSFAKNFNYEFSGGVGYMYNIFNNNECNCEHNSTTIDLQARIGYNF